MFYDGKLFTVAFAALLAVADSYTCPPGYHVTYQGKCMRFSDTKTDYYNAKAACEADGTTLVSIHSQEENDALQQIVPRGGDMWIGFECNPETYEWSWTDGTPVDFVGEFYGAPCDLSNVLFRNDGTWLAYDSDDLDFYGCEIDPNVTPCGPFYQLVDEIQYCLRVFNTTTDWTTAEAACRDDSATLVSIHDAKVNDYLRRHAQNNRFREGFHIGLNFKVQGHPLWADGTPYDYNNYAPGFPSTVFGLCTAMDVSSLAGEWISIECDERAQLPYICGKSANESIPTNVCGSKTAFIGQGTLTSPNYPGPYPSGLSCEYFFGASDAAHRVRVTFNDFMLDEADAVLLYDGETNDVPFANLTGRIYSNVTFTGQQSNILRLSFVTTTNHERGWNLTFASVLA